jgi:predicted DNA-binding transcriptional regulator AlpA
MVSYKPSWIVDGGSMEKIAATIAQSVALSGLSRSSIYKLINERRLNPRKAGKRTLILVSELNDYVNSLPARAPPGVRS